MPAIQSILESISSSTELLNTNLIKIVILTAHQERHFLHSINETDIN